MALDENVLRRAQKGDRDAIETVLVKWYPAVHRLSCALCGREDVGNGTARFVMRQAARRMPRMRDPDDAQRWFWHHTILTARRAAGHFANAEEDLLLRMAPARDPAYTAFVRSLRALPFQQGEAFLLHHGEQMQDRDLGIAMDCSTQAAHLHLSLATKTLHGLAGDDMPRLTTMLAQAYQRLSPDESYIQPAIRKVIAPVLRRRSIGRAIKIALFLIGAVGGAWLGIYLLKGWRF